MKLGLLTIGAMILKKIKKRDKIVENSLKNSTL